MASDFARHHGSSNVEEFAKEAARPARPSVADITRAELVEIVRRAFVTSPETDYYLCLFEANVLPCHAVRSPQGPGRVRDL